MMGADLFKNYLKVAWRNIIRHKGYSLINIFGLAVGMACCILIALFVQHELSYDRFHENANRIFRLGVTLKLPIGDRGYSIVRSDIVPAIAHDLPEVEEAVRLVDRGSSRLSCGDKKFKVDMICADPNFLSFFTFPLLRGDRAAVLREPHTIVISEEVARQFFGDQDPLGQSLSFEKKVDFRVSGVLRNLPDNTHFKFSAVVPFVDMKEMFGVDVAKDFVLATTYLRLKRGASARELARKLPRFNETHFGKRALKNLYFLQPLAAIHLGSNLFAEFDQNSDIKYSYFLSLLALFILLMAGVNYMNLAAALSLQRVKEVGVRQVVGARRGQVAAQFLGESLFLSFLALILALILAELLLPFFNTLIKKNLHINYSKNFLFYLILLGIALFAGLFSGSYPTWLASRFRPAAILKSKAPTRLGSSRLRNILVMFQFAVSVWFIGATLVVVKQIRYVRSRPLGFDKENVLVLPVYDMGEEIRTFKQELLRDSRIDAAAICSYTPGFESSWPSVVRPEGGPEGASFNVTPIGVDEDYFQTLGMRMTEGRFFSSQRLGDYKNAVIINQEAARLFGWKEAVGQRLSSDSSALPGPRTVIGVATNVHFTSLHKKIDPFLFYFITGENLHGNELAVKINPRDVPGALAFIRETWRRFSPYGISSFDFVSERFDKLYEEDRRAEKVFAFAAVLSVAISGLGLFGLTSFAAATRTKEIGMRKVLGASEGKIVSLISREFLRSALLANVIAWPLVYVVMRRWLQSFAYRTSFGLETVVLGSIFSLAIAVASVAFQSFRAARANPVESLRYE